MWNHNPLYDNLFNPRVFLRINYFNFLYIYYFLQRSGSPETLMLQPLYEMTDFLKLLACSLVLE